MNKLILITIILLSNSGNSFAQTARATASATIVTSVGAETSGAINFDYSVKKDIQRSTSAIADNSHKVCTPASSLNIIGGSLADDVSVQNELIILKNNSGSGSIKVKVSKALPDASQSCKDKISVPVEAVFASNTGNLSGNYSSSYRITVNFN